MGDPIKFSARLSPVNLARLDRCRLKDTRGTVRQIGATIGAKLVSQPHDERERDIKATEVVVL